MEQGMPCKWIMLLKMAFMTVFGGVWMPQVYEVAVLGEPVDDRQDDRLAVDMGKSLHEVHGDISPCTGRHVKRVEQASGVEMLGLVAPASSTSSNEVLDHLLGTGDVEVEAQSLMHLDHAFMGCVVGGLQDVGL
jgi:hypothetical protein